MSKISTFIRLLKKDRSDLMSSVLSHFSFLFPDKAYLTLLYRLKMGCWISWKNPKKFTEKLQWLKLYNRKPEYTTMVDKYAVKEYVAKIIGEEYIIPTLGVWNRPEDIDWDSLPDKFVLKTTHGGGGGGVIICRDKATLDKKRAIAKLTKSFKQDIYRNLREWPYKNVPRRIIAETFMEESLPVKNEGELNDFKFYCFNGEPTFMLMSVGRFTDRLCFDYYDMDWNKLSLVWDRPNSNIEQPCPPCFEEMQNLCRKLSKDIPHIRCDFYIINNKPYFGELTFFDSSGFSHFEDKEWDYRLGKMIKLPID